MTERYQRKYTTVHDTSDKDDEWYRKRDEKLDIAFEAAFSEDDDSEVKPSDARQSNRAT